MPTSSVYNLVGGSLLTSHINNPEGVNINCSIQKSNLKIVDVSFIEV